MSRCCWTARWSGYAANSTQYAAGEWLFSVPENVIRNVPTAAVVNARSLPKSVFPVPSISRAISTR